MAQAQGPELAQVPATAKATGHLNTKSSVGDLLGHPAFRGFARLMLPWDDRRYDEGMRLSEIGSLLPYHSHVDPAVTVAALNRMIDDADAGKTVFHDFYTETQKRKQPARANTGLFFFRGKPGAPFAVIAPGGGFSYVGSVHESFPHAVEISSKGYNAFVLKYRAGYGGRVATEDLAAAISYVFRHAAALGIGTDGYSLWGSSAGARTAAAIGSHGAAEYGGDDVFRPSTVVMAYTAHQDHSLDEPSTFVVVGERDGIAPPSVMERRVMALRSAGTRVEYHQYRDLGHGFGPGTGTGAAGWIGDAIRFWEASMKAGSSRQRRRRGMINKPAITVLAVGTTGSIGRHVVAEALRQGHAVRALVQDASQAGQLPPAAKVVTGDLTRADTAAHVQGDAPLTRDPRLDVHAPPAHNAVRRDVGPGAYQTRNLRLLLGQSTPPIRLPRPVSMGLRPRSRLTTGRTASAATPSRRAGSTRTSASPPSVRCRTRPCAAGA